MFDDAVWDAGLQGAPANSSSSLLRVIHGARLGKTITIDVWGGSQTLGKGCVCEHCVTGKLCSWSGRFADRIRRAYPGLQVVVNNRAISACPLKCSMPLVATHYTTSSGPAPDIVFLLSLKMVKRRANTRL